jgi:hypothetical protein
MAYGKDPVAQNVEDAFWGSQGVPVNSPAGQHAYQQRPAAQPDSPPPIQPTPFPLQPEAPPPAHLGLQGARGNEQSSRPKPAGPLSKWLTKWVWDLADTLTFKFDSFFARISKTRSWHLICVVAALVVGWAARARIADGVSWTDGFGWFVLALGLCVGFMLPYVLFAVTRGLLWVVGILVAISGGLAFGVIVIGAAGAAGYLLILLVRAFA